MSTPEPDPGGFDRPETGIIAQKINGIYTVQSGSCAIACLLPSRLKDALAVGDEVRFTRAAQGPGRIVAALPRRSKLARRSAVAMPSAHPFEQVIAANVDQVVPVLPASPPPNWNLLDRYLVSSESSSLPSLICITKLDLAGDDEHLQQVLDVYRRIGYPALITSAATGVGLDLLRQALQGRVSVLVGKSGAGKTSLLNALQPGLGLRVQEVSRATGKGRHTTTVARLFPLESGGTGVSLPFPGAIIDTPGLREFGLWDVDADDLASFFPEMRPYLGRCKFRLDCSHDEEPGCEVRKAVNAGLIEPRRYRSYLRLRADP